MRFFKRILGAIGFSSHNDSHENPDEDDENYDNNHTHSSDFIRRNRGHDGPTRAGPRRGFSVPAQVPTDRYAVGPILLPCNGDAGVQGLRWYASCLKTDEDGDVADEFLCEVPTYVSSRMQDQGKSMPKLQVKHNATRATVRDQVLTPDGKLQHYVEFQGRLQWV